MLSIGAVVSGRNPAASVGKPLNVEAFLPSARGEQMPMANVQRHRFVRLDQSGIRRDAQTPDTARHPKLDSSRRTLPTRRLDATEHVTVNRERQTLVGEIHHPQSRAEQRLQRGGYQQR